MSFRELHIPGAPLVMPNAWDAGSARILESLGFPAIASTSAGAAFAQGLPDGALSPEELVTAGAELVRAVEIPVSADLENCGADIQATITAAGAAGLAGGSIEDFTGDPTNPIYPFEEACERVAAAVAAARALPGDFVLTARAEGFLHGQPDMDAVVARLTAFAELGADAIYAPGLTDLDQIRRLTAIGCPVNVLATSAFTVAELAEAGVARISLGSGLARQALGGVIRFAQTLQDEGRLDYSDIAGFAEIEALLSR